MSIEFTKEHVIINGKQYYKSYLERILEIPQGTLDNTTGNDFCVLSILKIIEAFPSIVHVIDSRYEQKEIQKFNEQIEDMRELRQTKEC